MPITSASVSRTFTPSEPRTHADSTPTVVSIAFTFWLRLLPASTPRPLPASTLRPRATTSTVVSSARLTSSLSSTEPGVVIATFALLAVITPIVTWSATPSPAVIRMSPSTVFSVASAAIVRLPVPATTSRLPAPVVVTSTPASNARSSAASTLTCPVPLRTSAPRITSLPAPTAWSSTGPEPSASTPTLPVVPASTVSVPASVRSTMAPSTALARSSSAPSVERLVDVTALAATRLTPIADTVSTLTAVCSVRKTPPAATEAAMVRTSTSR